MLTYVLRPIVSATLGAAIGVALATAIVKSAEGATLDQPRAGILPVVTESGKLSDDLLRMVERLQ